MILVTGATGKVGQELVKDLVAKGEQVRAMSRNPEKAAEILGPGVEIVAGDLEKPETLEAALQGVEKAFLLSDPGPNMAEAHGNFVEAAKRAGLRHLVRLSVLPAGAESPITLGKWHKDADELVIQSGIPYTILRPGYFMQNAFNSASTIASEGAIYLPMGDGKVGMVDARDIAEVAATVLRSGGHEGKIYPLTGSESLSQSDVAAKLSVPLGKEIKYVNVPPEAAKNAMTGMGMPDWLADSMVEMGQMISEGGADMVAPTVKQIIGREPLSFDQFAREFADTFKGN